MEPPKRTIAIVIPAFNEEKSIRAVVEDVGSALHGQNLDGHIIVVNDGSSDGTAAVVGSLPCTLLNLPFNLGIGAAVQLGMRYALELGCIAAVQVDGDGQHPACAIGRLLEPIIDDRADVVIGSRFLLKGGSRSTFGRRIGIRYFNALVGLLIGRRITDSTSGLRALNCRALEVCAEEYPDQYPEPEALISFTKRNLRIAEVSVRMNDRQGGQSSISMFAGGVYMIKVSLAVLVAALRTHQEG
jgi:glycosyltransferase involved in cell wall biosynthesis